MKQEEKELDAAGPLYAALSNYNKLDPATPSPLSVGTPGDRRSNPVEDRFKDSLERERAESEEGESMNETLSEAGEKWWWETHQTRLQLKGFLLCMSYCKT